MQTKNFQKSIIFIFEILIFLGLFVIFFGLFYIDSPQIVRPSRTSGITMTTFTAVGLSLFYAYGGFAVGKKVFKDIVLSLFISVLFTDIITYFEFSIMNVNQYKNQYLNFDNIGILFIVILLQFIYIYIVAHLGDELYYKLNPPERCSVIMFDESKKTEYLTKIAKHKKRYSVTNVSGCSDVRECKKYIRFSDTVFLFDVPIQMRSELIEFAYRHQKKIYFSLDFPDVVVNQSKHILIDDMSMLFTSFKGLSLEQRIAKRALDIIVSGFGLILLAPIILIEAIAVKLYDRGPVFYKQERLTLDGRIFEVLKFRTMIVDAEKGKAVLSSKNDSRVTPVGKILRATRLDEIPQLINVFLGQMSIVGPRPERKSIALEYTKDIPEFRFRLRAKAGLTGLAQILGKYNTTPKDKLILDLMYIEGYSIWKDILLILQTILIFFKTESTEGFDKDVDNVEFDLLKENPNEEIKVYEPSKKKKKK